MNYFEIWIKDINEYLERKVNYESQFFLKKIFTKDKIRDLEFVNKIDSFFDDEFIFLLTSNQDKIIFLNILEIYNKFNSILSYEKNYKLLDIFLGSDLISQNLKNPLFNFKSAMEIKHQSEININSMLSNLK